MIISKTIKLLLISSELYLKKALDIQYLNFILNQKQYLPTFNKFKNLYALENDTNQTAIIDRLVMVLFSMNHDMTYNAFYSTIFFPDIISFTNPFSDLI